MAERNSLDIRNRWMERQIEVGSLPVEQIIGFWQITVAPRHATRTHSTPGHLIHLLLEGRYALEISGRRYQPRAGDLIYYHDSEEVVWLGNPDTVRFYSVAFYSRQLSPPPVEHRFMRAPDGVRAAFDDMFAASRMLGGVERTCRLYAALLTVMASLPLAQSVVESPSQDELWWDVERWLREKRAYRIDVNSLAKQFHTSRATLLRSCRRALDMTPLQRIRELRMEEARGLLLYSHMNIGEIAAELDYPRIHEFSRHFSQHFGTSPTRFASEHRRS